MGREVERARGSNSAEPAGSSARPGTASTKGTDADFFIVHLAVVTGRDVTAAEREAAKERTGRAALTKANMADGKEGEGAKFGKE